MRLTLDTDLHTLTVSASCANPLGAATAQRGDGETLQLQLTRKGVPYQAVSTVQLRFVAKRNLKIDGRLVPDFAGTALAMADTFTYDATAACYVAAIDYATAALDALLLIGQTPETDSVTLAAQVAIRPTSSDSWSRSQYLPFTLNNAVWRGSEVNPSTGLPAEPGAGPFLRPAIIALTADQAFTGTAYAPITGLSFPVESGQMYGFRFMIPYSAPSTGIGARFAVYQTAVPTRLNVCSRWTLTETTEKQVASPSVDAGTVGATSLVTGNLAIIEGVIIPSADGDLVARAGTETSGQAITVLSGANVTWWQMAN